ncbi:hypothetical protein [Photobacterium sp. GB-56]|uniref:hypothetical protein n=1 Tax=Photobacterium sp. GB-56 TaxID=2022106 RepID=UPI000D182E04|nr:hypothetical protein [Photobacterium sp. GB-56]PSV21040.1 hypothetical protein C9J42_21085 [Photobacterium sp. GB-56]
MIDFIGKVFSGLATKFVGDKVSEAKKSKLSESKLKAYIKHQSVDIDQLTNSAYELWEISFKCTEFKLYFQEPEKFIIPRDFDSERIQSYLNECADCLNETLRVTVTALLRHIGNYDELKQEIVKLGYDFDEEKSYRLYIESLYIRRYVIALAHDWENVVLLTAENHTHEQLVSPLGLPVNLNSLRAKIMRELRERT